MTFDLSTVEIPEKIIAYGRESVVERWLEWCHDNGGPPSTPFQEDLAEMFARKRAGGIAGTDSQNFAGTHNNPFPNMPEKLRQHYIKQCKEQGISFAGKVYKAGLVRKGYGGARLDPEALVDSTGDVKRLLQQRGWGAEGMVNIEAADVDVDMDREYRVSDKLVDEVAADEVIENHGGRIKKKEYADLREKVKARLKGEM